MKNFKTDFNGFKEKLINKEPFAFSRYSDGELYILKNIELKLDEGIIQIGNTITNGPYKKEDFKHFNPSIHSDFRNKLIEAFKYKSKNYYKGISCKCCVGYDDFMYQIKLHDEDEEYLTWSNIFVNANYPSFIKEILPIMQTYDSVMVCNENANLEKLEFVFKDFRVGYNAMVNNYNTIEEIKTWINENKIENKLFLFSASTFSNIAIYELFKFNNKNTYIDIGTCLTPYMDMPMHRSYLQEYWFNSNGNDLKKVCIW